MMVRAAEHSDGAGIVSLMASEMLAEAGFDSPQDVRRGAFHIHKAIDDGLCFVAVEGEDVLGVIQFMKVQPWWTSRYVLMDCGFFVGKKHRGRASKMLLEKAKEFATMQEMPMVIGVLSKDKVAAKAKWLERQGLENYGVIYGRGL